MIASKKVAKMIEGSLKPKRIFLVIEGMEINHIHIKLYPKYKIERKVPSQKTDYIYDEKYYGYITTLHGPKARNKELEKISKKIRLSKTK
jgi:diadenosine tetraphosphate (Ap4A) HIT family hydrolase